MTSTYFKNKKLFLGQCGTDLNRREWKCLSTSQCISRTMLCDNQYQCQDLSDESICSHYFDCISSTYYNSNSYYNYNLVLSFSQSCIPSLLVCDGIPDCYNHADEQHCSNVFWNIMHFYKDF